MDRIKQLTSHLTGPSNGLGFLKAQRSDDVVITMAIRSPMCKVKKGGFKDTHTDELLAEMFRQAVSHSKIDPSVIGDICVGTVNTVGATYIARSAMLAAGIPDTVPVQTINRFCSSGLMAVTTIGNQIRSGQIQVGLAVGVESMTHSPDPGAPPISEDLIAHSLVKDASMPMGWTSENVAADFDISRTEMDHVAAVSFQRAERAQKAGYYDAEIVPFEAYVKDASGTRVKKIIDKDDGIRYGTTQESLSKIRGAFPQWGKGQTTGGNASQITDGASAVLLMTRKKAEELGLDILGKWVTTSVCGLAPRIMGIGPSIAIPMVLENVGITKDDVDIFEINEAFASMYVYCLRKLNLDIEKVNVNGGAIALGHPLGCTGTRQIATGLHELRRREGKGKILCTSMCIGTGMGAAAIFVSE